MSSGVTSMAAEIERLRANVEREHQLNRPLVSEIERLKQEITGHLKAWDIEHAEVERLRLQLWTDDEVEHEMALARNIVIEECARVAETYAKHLWPTAIPRSEFVAAIRALKDKP